MRIDSIEVEKFCQFDNLKAEFSPRLNAIRGPNGAGKTNLLNSIVYGCTGDLSRLVGVKKDNIKQPAGPRAKSRIQLGLSHGDKTATVTRAFTATTSTNELRVPWRNDVITRADEVNNELFKWLGVSESLLLDYVFVKQWGMFSFIDQSPTVRAAALSELFGTDVAEKVYSWVGDEKIEVPSAATDTAAVEKQLQDWNDEAAELTKGLAAERFKDLPDDWNPLTDPDQKIMADWTKRQFFEKQQAAKLRQMNDYTERFIADQRTLEHREKELKEATSFLAEMKDTVHKTEAELAKWKTYNMYAQYKAKQDAVKQKIADKCNELAKLVFPVRRVEKTPEELRPLRTELEDVKFEERQLDQFIKSVNDLLHDPFGKPNCPHCGTPAESLKTQVEIYQKKRDALRPRKVSLNAIIETSDLYNNAVYAFKTTETRLIQEVAALREQITDVPAVEMPTQPEADLKELLESYKQVTDDTSASAAEVAALRKAHDELGGQIRQTHTEYIQLLAYLNEYRVTKADHDKAQAMYSLRADLSVERQNIEARIKALGELIKTNESILERCRNIAKQSIGTIQAIAHLADTREAIKELPKIAAQYHMEEIAEKVNEQLELFDAPFRIQSVTDLRFMLKFRSGKIQPAERLSGGQRVVFALAFRLVIHSKFAKEIGLLCLDEPTAGLDVDNLACLEVALGRLRELSQARGLQVILITHDSGLDGLFDRVIQLPAAS